MRFHDSVEVQVMAHGDLNKARFVQVMEGHVVDQDRAVERHMDITEPWLMNA